MVFDRFLSEISSASFVYFLVAIFGEHTKDTHEYLLIKFRSNPFPLIFRKMQRL